MSALQKALLISCAFAPSRKAKLTVTTFVDGMPAGLHLQALFKPIIGGSLSFSDQGLWSGVSFQVTVDHSLACVYYEGPSLSSAHGDVSHLRFGPSGSPWGTYGESSGAVLFTYDHVKTFHRQ